MSVGPRADGKRRLLDSDYFAVWRIQLSSKVEYLYEVHFEILVA